MHNMEITIQETRLQEAASQGTDAFLTVIHDAILGAVGGEVNAETLPHLNGEQTTLLAYFILREEVMDGGFVQLIHNGYGPFIFLNPFAKAMRLWGAHDFSKLVYRGLSPHLLPEQLRCLFYLPSPRTFGRYVLPSRFHNEG